MFFFLLPFFNVMKRSKEGFKNGSRPGSAHHLGRNASDQDIKEVISPSPTKSPGNSRPASAYASTRGMQKTNDETQNLFPVGMSFNATAAHLNQNPRNYRPDSAKRERPKLAAAGTNTGTIPSNRLDALGGPPASPTDNYRPQVPSHVIYANEVLRFYGQFSEVRPWEIGPLGTPTVEKEIVRNVTIAFYLEDGTVSVTEGAGENGMTGGTFYKRGLLKKPDGSMYIPDDFSIGKIVQIVGQDIQIYDIDKKTREYFRKVQKIVMPPALNAREQSRNDLGVAMATGGGKHFPEKHDPNGNFRGCSQKYIESREHMATSYAFMRQEKRNLCFEAILCSTPDGPTEEDMTMGTAKRYTISFSLTEQTMEIGPAKEKRSAYDEATSILKRSKLAKNWRDVQRGKKPIYYEAKDLICGTMIECYGRHLLLVDCDDATRRKFEDEGVIQRRIELFVPEEKVVQKLIPKLGDGFLAIGTEEDTMGTIHGMPKPRKDLEKLQRNQGRKLRCKTHLISDIPADKGREFMVTYYLEDDSIQIYEEIKRNSGLAGGNFLKKGRYLNTLPTDSDEVRHFAPKDFFLGNVFCINGNEMRIVEMDNMSLRFCESYPMEFPMFDVFAIIHSLLKRVISKQLDLRKSMSKFDKSKDGYLPKEDFVFALDNLQITAGLNDQELLTLLRRFQNDENKYQYDELCDLFSQVYHQAKRRGTLRAPYKVSHETEAKMSKFMNYLRGHKTHLRRLFRKNVHSYKGNITLYQLRKLMQRYGFKVSDDNKDFIVGSYSLPSQEAASLIERLNSPHDFDALENVDIEKDYSNDKKSSPCRLDMRSSTRMNNSMSPNKDNDISDIQFRRQQVMKSVLRKPVDIPSYNLEDDVDESQIVISYRKFCDDVYKADWIFSK